MDAKQIRRAADQRGMRIEELAVALHVSFGTAWKIYHGKSKPSRATAENAERAFGKPGQH